MQNKLFIGFYVEKLYFMPHFEPIIEVVKNRSLEYTVIIPKGKKRDELNQRQETIEYCQKKQLNFYLEEECPALRFLVFANTPHSLSIDYEKSIIVFHGTWGGKNVYLDAKLNDVDIRFIEGPFYEELLGSLYPEQAEKLCISGYSKLDSYFKLTEADKVELLNRCHLDLEKKTILYAPTFYPSSILRLKKDFPETFKECNIIIKPHSNIFLRKQYRKALKHIQNWGKYPNVYISDFKETNLLPFMYASDLMISDISSAVYEFAGIGKPVVINMFLHYRFHHLIFPSKIENRLDRAHFDLWNVGSIANSYSEMVTACKENILYPEKAQQQREKYVNYVLGSVDGKSSERIINKLLAI